MQRTLHFDLKKVLFDPQQLQEDPLPDFLESEESTCKCGYEQAEVYTQNEELLCTVCANISGEKVVVDLKDIKSKLKLQLKLIRRFLYEGTLYLEYSKNFISTKLYKSMSESYHNIFSQYEQA